MKCTGNILSCWLIVPLPTHSWIQWRAPLNLPRGGVRHGLPWVWNSWSSPMSRSPGSSLTVSPNLIASCPTPSSAKLIFRAIENADLGFGEQRQMEGNVLQVAEIDLTHISFMDQAILAFCSTCREILPLASCSCNPFRTSGPEATFHYDSRLTLSKSCPSSCPPPPTNTRYFPYVLLTLKLSCLIALKIRIFDT